MLKYHIHVRKKSENIHSQRSRKISRYNNAERLITNAHPMTLFCLELAQKLQFGSPGLSREINVNASRSWFLSQQRPCPYSFLKMKIWRNIPTIIYGDIVRLLISFNLVQVFVGVSSSGRVSSLSVLQPAFHAKRAHGIWFGVLHVDLSNKGDSPTGRAQFMRKYLKFLDCLSLTE